jgi:polyhydroxyalkanoate synthase subunit PhaE
MTASPFDFGLEAMASFWTQAGKALLDAQAMMARAMGGAATAPNVALPVPVADTAGLAKAAGAIAELWAKAAGMAGALASTMSASAEPAQVDPTIAATFVAMTDPRRWLTSFGGLDAVIGRVLEGPQLADLWSVERQQARVLQAWMRARQRALEHGGVVLEAWLRAAQAYGEEVARAASAHKLRDSKSLMALWTETANRVLLETQRSDRFLETQAAMIRASTELRLAQQEIAERWSAQFGMPTRTCTSRPVPPTFPLPSSARTAAITHRSPRWSLRWRSSSRTFRLMASTFR